MADQFLSMQQLAQYAYQAGFRGQALSNIVAIAWAESGGKINALGDGGQSHGLVQVYAPAHPNYDANRLMTDPLYAFQAAFEISGKGTNFNPWTTWSHTTTSGAQANAQQYLGAAGDAANAVGGAAGYGGQPNLQPASKPYTATGTGAANAMPTQATPTTGTPSSQPPAKYSLPSDAQVFIIDGRMPVVMFDLGGGVWVKYNIGDFSNLNAGNFPVHQISGQEMNAMNPVDGGSAAELGSVSSTWGSYSSWWDHTIMSSFPDTPSGHAAMQDPQVRRIIAEAASRPDGMSPEELQNRLLGTSYVQGKSGQAVKYDNATSAEQNAMVQEEAASLVDMWWKNVGQAIDVTDPRIVKWATDVASGKIGEGGILYQQILPEARKNPQSPRSRAEEGEKENQLKQGNDIENKTVEITNLFHQWGIQGDPSLFTKWAHDIVTGARSDGDLTGYLSQQAKVLYPWKDPTMSTQDAAQPWISTYQRVMENAPKDGLFDPLVQKALNNGTPLWQFEKDLKNDPRWLQTNNARDDMTSAMTQAGKVMGFN